MSTLAVRTADSKVADTPDNREGWSGIGSQRPNPVEVLPKRTRQHTHSRQRMGEEALAGGAIWGPTTLKRDGP
jgi:hypothetical protein